MLQDVLGSVIAVLAFALVLYAPGYIFAYGADLFGFRKMDFAERSVWSIACSFCAVPILLHLAGRLAGLAGIIWLLYACSLIAIMLMWRARRASEWPRRDKRITALVASGWTLLVLLLLVDAQVGRKLYFSVVMADQSYRIAFTDAVVRTGVPPANPLYFAGSPAPMRYFYFWYVLCAAVVKLAHVTARQAFVASSVWAGFGLLATVTLYTQHFFRWGKRQRWIALGLLLVTGADLVPALGNAVLQQTLNGDTEWWSVDPIDAWPDSLLWVPHHVASVLCCLLAFLLIWRMRETITRSTRRWSCVLAALAFASAFGLSVYVAFGFAVLMLAWLIRSAWLRYPDRQAIWRRVAMTALLSAVVLTPFGLELAHHAGPASAAPAPAGHVFSLSVRRMIDSGLITRLPAFDRWNAAHPVLLDQTIRLVLLLPGLAMELGLFGAVLFLLLREKRSNKPAFGDDARGTALFFTVCGLVMTMFLSSSVITNNDFGYRAVMLPQFFLLLLTAEVLSFLQTTETAPVVLLTPARRKLLQGLLALGILGSVCWAILLRAWMPFEEPRQKDGYDKLPQDAFQIRESFAALDATASASAVVGFRPIAPEVHEKDEVMTPNEFYQRMLVMNTGRQMLNAEQKCAVHFGGNPRECREIQAQTDRLYAYPIPDAAWAKDYCVRFGVEYLTLSHRDPIWPGNTGWPTGLPTVGLEPGFKIVRCAAIGQPR